MEEFWAPIAGVLGAYILIDNVYTKLKARLHPATSLPSKVALLEKGYANYLTEHENTMAQYNKQFEEFEKINKLQCKAMLDIMRHMRDGNHVENMNKTIREIEDILIDI